jgi:uncharacterized protein (TIGR02594 family)
MRKLFKAALLTTGLCFASIVSMPAYAKPTQVEEQTVSNKKVQTTSKKKTNGQKKHVNRNRKSKKVVAVKTPPPEPCHFLFWEVECASVARSSFADNIPRSDSFVPRHIVEAKAQIGLNARTDRKVLENKFAKTIGQRVDPVRIPWCAAWVNSVLADAGVSGTDSLMARSFLNWGHDIRNPKQGDVVVLRRGRNRNAGHVGFFIEHVMIDGKKFVAVLGGNQGKSVSIAYYAESRVLGYRAA